MSGSEPTQAQSRTTAPPPAAPRAMALLLPAVTAVASAVESVASVVLPTTPKATAAPAQQGAANPETTGPAQSSEQPGFFSWIAGKASVFFSAVGEHASRLGEVRDFDGLCTWAKNAASDAWEGIKSTAREVSHAVAEVFTGGGETHEHHQLKESSSGELFGEVTEALTEAAAFTAEAIAKRKEQLEELYEHLRAVALGHEHGHNHSGEALPHDSSHMAVRFAAHMIDSLTLGNLRLAILGNEIPPECMVEVRRLLAEIDAEKLKNIS